MSLSAVNGYSALELTIVFSSVQLMNRYPVLAVAIRLTCEPFVYVEAPVTLPYAVLLGDAETVTVSCLNTAIKVRFLSTVSSYFTFVLTTFPFSVQLTK